MRMLFFLAFAFNRLKSRLGLTAVVILSIALSIGLLAGVTVFSNAVSLRLMQDELAQRVERLNRPAFVVRAYAIPRAHRPISLQNLAYWRDWLASALRQQLELPIQSIYMQAESRAYQVRPVVGDQSFRFDREIVDSARVVVVQDVEPHIAVVEGLPFGQTGDAGELPVWVEAHYAKAVGFQVGDRYLMGQANARPSSLIPVHIAGFWTARDREEAFWYRDPVSLFTQAFLTTGEQYAAHLYPRLPEQTSFVFWFVTLDESRLNLDDGQRYVDGLRRFMQGVQKYLPDGKVDISPLEELARGQQRKLSLTTVMLGFALPLILMLSYFVASLSAMQAKFQRREIALLASRGGSSSQVLALISLETLLILCAAVPLGLVIGLGQASLMSSSASFLKFDARQPLPVHVETVDWRLVGAGLALSVAARLWPTWQASRVSVVGHERQAARPAAAFSAGRLFVVALLAAVTYYAYRQLMLKGTLGAVSWHLDESSNDPLLLIAPTLFLFTAPLVMVEVFVLLTRPIGVIGKWMPSFTAYLGCMNLGREGGQYRTPAYLLLLCLSMGVFYASIALSADLWLVERRQYEVGSDLTFKPAVLQGGDPGFSGNPVIDEAATSALPLSYYQDLPGVAAATRVAELNATVPVEGLTQVRLLAIDRAGFPDAAHYRRDFAAHPLGEMMNRLAAQPNGVIVSKSLLDILPLGVGDVVPLTVIADNSTSFRIDFKIVDTFDYFPTLQDVRERPSAIVNAEFLDLAIGPFQSRVWMRLNAGADGKTVLDELENARVIPVESRDLRNTLLRDQQRLERVGLFGLLSICFLAGALLAAVGSLLYSYISLVARAQRFAVMRAMGMRRAEVVRSLLVEYVFTLTYGILAGTALGVLAARLYVPLFPLTDQVDIPVPPFNAIIDWPRAAWIAALMTMTLSLIVGLAIAKMARERVFEALRMGGWE